MKHVSGFYHSMAGVMNSLESIAQNELSGQPLTTEQIQFMQQVMYMSGCGPTPDGWYLQLCGYDLSMDGSEPGWRVKYTVADVHASPSDENQNPVGWVLHVGTGDVNLGVVIAPSQNSGLCAYVGPMFSYYENTTSNYNRMTDAEWTTAVQAGYFPRPVWVNNYLADSSGGRRVAGPDLQSLRPGVCRLSSPVNGVEALQSHPVFHY